MCLRDVKRLHVKTSNKAVVRSIQISGKIPAIKFLKCTLIIQVGYLGIALKLRKSSMEEETMCLGQADWMKSRWRGCEEGHSWGRPKTLGKKQRTLAKDQEEMMPRSQSRNSPACSVRLDLEGKVNDVLEGASGFANQQLLTNSVRNSHIQPISDSNALFLLEWHFIQRHFLYSLCHCPCHYSPLHHHNSLLTSSPYCVLLIALQTAAWEIFVTEKSNFALRVQSWMIWLCLTVHQIPCNSQLSICILQTSRTSTSWMWAALSTFTALSTASVPLIPSDDGGSSSEEAGWVIKRTKVALG